MPIASASTSVRQTQTPNAWKKKKTRTPSPSASRETVDSEGDTIPGECCQYTSQLGDDLAYLHLLKTQNAVTPVNKVYRAFVMQDFNFTTTSLKDEYLIIRRQATKVPERYMWLYGCSCNSARQTILNSVSCSLSGPVKDFDHSYNKCYHIEAMQNIASQVTDVNLENELNRRFEEMNGKSVEHSYEKQGPKLVIKNKQFYVIFDRKSKLFHLPN